MENIVINLSFISTILKYPILVGEQSANNNMDNNHDIQVSLWKIMEWLINTLPECIEQYWIPVL